MFIDETGASTKMARRYGRAPRGERCRAPVPHGHWKTTTFVGALRLEGMTAPMVLDGAMHGAAFLAYVEQVLVPTLIPGDIVIMERWRSQSSRPSSRKLPHEPSTTSGTPSQKESTHSRQQSAKTTSLPPVMTASDRKML